MNILKLWIAVAFLICVGNASSADIHLVNESLRSKYSRTETVSLSIENRGNKSVKLYSNAEIFDSGEWSAWSYGIEDGRSEAVSTMHRLKPSKSMILNLSFTKVEPPPIPAGEDPACEREPLFRLRVVTVDRKGEKSESFSKPFKIVDPYGICAENGFVR